ncbi:MAG: bacteriohopanetetrol glucosamine biosynthesis glycosyltransferase HpnI [Candidatus Acidiferrales bacterium]|jgi:ceramide glucosyltransferase
MRIAAILLFVVFTGTGGELALAHAMQLVGEVRTLGLRDVLHVVGRAFTIGWLWLGVGLMAVSFFAFLTMLSWYAVGFVVPATSLAYVAGAIGAWLLLREQLSAVRWAGILLICCGVAFAWADRTPAWLTAHAVFVALRWAVLGAALGPLIYYAVGTFAAWRFFRWAHRAERSGRAADHASPTALPPASILKPLRGLDPDAYENFASFCRLDYPEYEILFAVSDAADPAAAIVQRLIADFPHRAIRLIVTGAAAGANIKVSNLCRLVREARYDLLVESDSDVRVEADYLRGVAERMTLAGVGAVTALYRGIAAPNWVAALDCVGSSSAFCGAALVARELEGLKFMMGSTIATTRQRLAEIGGFEGLLDLHSDDYELGRRIAARGWRIELTAKPVGMIFPAETLAEYFRHELRWAIGIRNIRPGGHLGLFFTHGLPLAIAAAILAPSHAIAAAYLGAYLVLRFAMAWTVGAWGLRDPVVRRAWWLFPLRDALAYIVWLASFASNRVEWRGNRFRLERGRMIPLAPRG